MQGYSQNQAFNKLLNRSKIQSGLVVISCPIQIFALPALVPVECSDPAATEDYPAFP
jgi:hypothetical protein